MTTPIRVLILEDNPSDADRMLNELNRAGFDAFANLVKTEQEFRKQVQRAPDVILAECSLPGLSALDALRVMQECELKIPYIVVSGKVSEPDEVEVLKRGAADCIMKDSLGSLGPAVKHALEKKGGCVVGRARRTNGGDGAPSCALLGRWGRALAAVQRLLG